MQGHWNEWSQIVLSIPLVSASNLSSIHTPNQKKTIQALILNFNPYQNI